MPAAASRSRQGYLHRSWPDVFKESGAWPLASLRTAFLDGSLTRLLDPESPESWNRFGSKLIPKMRSGGEVEVRVEISCCLQAGAVSAIESELLQIRQDLGLSSQIRIEKGSAVGFGE